MFERKNIRLAGLFVAILFFFGIANANEKKDYRVYQFVIESAQGSFENISNSLQTAIEDSASGWQLLTKIDAGVPKDCKYKARVFAIYNADYAKQLLEINRKTAPFAVVDRINLFEDENGAHVSVVNPHSINRTVLMEDLKYWDLNENHLQNLRKLITGAVRGTVSEKQYGQKRKKGKIGKTMGVMAGGPFEDKIQDEAVVTDKDWETVVAKVREGLRQTGEKWHMHLVYELELPGYQTVVFGTTGTPMDSKSFSIVKAGSDKSRKKFDCPGLADAGAYPIEVVVAKEDDGIKIRMVNTMFRMKMYFEDAGMWAFMKNMGMPGSIQDELNDQFKTALGL